MNVPDLRIAGENFMEAVEQIEVFNTEKARYDRELAQKKEHIIKLKTDVQLLDGEIKQCEELLKGHKQVIADRQVVYDKEIAEFERRKKKAMEEAEKEEKVLQEKIERKKILNRDIEEVINRNDRLKIENNEIETRVKDKEKLLVELDQLKSEVENKIKGKKEELIHLTEVAHKQETVISENSDKIEMQNREIVACKSAMDNYDITMKSLNEEKTKVKSLKNIFDTEMQKKEKEINERFADLTIREDNLKSNYNRVKKYNLQIDPKFQIILPNLQ